MGFNTDKANDWFLSNSPTPEIHIFLPQDVIISVSAQSDQIIDFVLKRLEENYALFDCSCNITSENSLKIIINNAHVLGATIEEHNGKIEFPELKEEIRNEIIAMLRELKAESHLASNRIITPETKEQIRNMRLNSNFRMELDQRIDKLNELSKSIFKDGEIFSLNANASVIDYIFIYTSRWDTIVKFSVDASEAYIMQAVRIIFDCKELGFELGRKYITPEMAVKDDFGFAIEQHYENDFFINTPLFNDIISNGIHELNKLEPKDHFSGNPDAIILHSFKDGFKVGSFLQAQSLIDQNKYGIATSYF